MEAAASAPPLTRASEEEEEGRYVRLGLGHGGRSHAPGEREEEGRRQRRDVHLFPHYVTTTPVVAGASKKPREEDSSSSRRRTTGSPFVGVAPMPRFAAPPRCRPPPRPLDEGRGQERRARRGKLPVPSCLLVIIGVLQILHRKVGWGDDRATTAPSSNSAVMVVVHAWTTTTTTTTTPSTASLRVLQRRHHHPRRLPLSLRATTLTETDSETETETTTSSSPYASSTASSNVRPRDASRLVKQMRSDLEQSNPDAALIMQALRGQNLNDDDAAIAGLEMRLVDVSSSRRGGQRLGLFGASSSSDVDDVLPLEYNPTALQQFFKKRPGAVLTRILQVLSVGGGFLLTLLSDQVSAALPLSPRKNKDELDDLEVKRAGQLRDIITSLGPFYIKIGQALSIRPDVLSPRSMVELQKLCDKVPSFPSDIAFRCIEEELGRSVDELFSDITPEPVAAASLGQVYRATLRKTGQVVAVKVQRPNVLETVSLDLYLARQAGLFARNFPALSSRVDAVALLDEFAYRFYQELDYVVECQNGFRIAEAMKKLPMVVIPRNFPDYTSRRVHVAEWIDGEKLSQSTADDVGALVNLGVITYLTQLLDAGFFHADPHPGNMMRTTDGKLAILDFGLMTDITEDQKYGMIEAIVHLINRDYSSIGQDFINLDFIPKGTDTSPIVPALTKVFDVALAGGGAKSINFQELASDLAQITFDYPFRIPPYFALVIRAISVLEGIALVGNPNFAIIDEAYPYIARQLMTDRSPRLRNALKYMVYGRDGAFDAENLIDLLQALEKFTAVRDEGDGTAFKVDGIRGSKAVGAAGDFAGSQKVDLQDRDTDVDGGRFRIGQSGNNGGPMISSSMGGASSSFSEAPIDPANDERTVREALRFFFGKDGDVFREFILEEVVTVVDASSREGLRELVRSLGLSNFPVPSFVRALTPALTENDKRMVQQIQKLVQFLLGDFDGSVTAVSSLRLRKLVPVVREFAPELRNFGTLLVARLTEKALSRGLNWATGRAR